MEWGTIFVYVCVNSCSPSDAASTSGAVTVAREIVVVQPEE